MAPMPPGPPPVEGKLALLRYLASIGRDPIGFQRRRFERYGDTYLSVVNGIETIVTRDPNHIHNVLVENGDAYQKPVTGIGAKQLKAFLGNGLVSSNGDFWRTQRRQIQPAFDGRHLRSYADTMVAFAAEAADSWDDGETFDASEAMMTLTLRVVGRVLFGQDTRAGTGEVADAMRAFRASFGGLGVMLPSFIPYSPRTRSIAARRRMYDLMDEWIAQCHAGHSPDPKCLLNVLVRGADGGSGMSDAQLRDEALTLFFAGHETTSHALTWALYLLSQHPRAYAHMRAEVANALGNRLATYDDFASLPYTQAALSEAMRIYPPVFAIARESKKDTRLGEYHVPRGAHVVVGIYHAQHDHKNHADPGRFDPSRFAPERSSGMHRGAYVPFGSGTRTCIGKRFALLEATLMLATFAQRAQLAYAGTFAPVVDTSVTLAPRGGLPMRKVKRTRVDVAGQRAAPPVG